VKPAKQIADTLLLTGWIRDEFDGRVLACAAGEEEKSKSVYRVVLTRPTNGSGNRYVCRGIYVR
jgi:acylphosphatase